MTHSPETPDSRPRLDRIGLAGLGLIAAATAAAYSRTLAVPFLFDDIGTIAKNASIRHWSGAFSPPFSTTAGGRPMLNFTLAMNYAMSGTAVWTYHLLNLAIHILAGMTLFEILRRTPGLWPASSASVAAGSAALLWTLHPLQTESVTYTIQRAESLMGLFYLLTLYCFIRQVERDEGRAGPSFAKASAGKPSPPRAGGLPDEALAKSGPALPRSQLSKIEWAGLSILFCLLGMATKEVMVSAPLMVLLYDRTFVAGGFREAWRRHRRIYAALGSTWLILPFLILSTHGRGGTSGFGIGVSWSRYAQTQFPAIVRYLKLSIWPHPLVFDYGTEWVRDAWSVLPSAAVVIALALGTVYLLFSPEARLRHGFGGHALAFAGAWFFAILAPSSLIPGNRQTAAEHRMYLALVPVVVMAVTTIYRRLPRLAPALCLMAAAGLFCLTWTRNRDYASALRLWEATVARCPDNAFAHNNLGAELEKLPGRNGEAMAELQTALRLDPNSAEAHNNIGNALSKLPGGLNDAIAEYEESIRLKPGLVEARCDLGNVLAQVPGRMEEAVGQYEMALRQEPNFAEARNSLGNILARMPGRLDQAMAQYSEALRLNPDYAQAHQNLGNALNRAGRNEEAMAEYEAALRLDPALAEAHNNLGNIMAARGQRAEAEAEFGAALRLNSEMPEAQNNLANILKAEGRTEEAITRYQAALRLQPGDAEAHYNLGNALIAAGRPEQAIVEYEEALRLKPDDPDIPHNLAVARQLLAQIPGH